MHEYLHAFPQAVKCSSINRHKSENFPSATKVADRNKRRALCPRHFFPYVLRSFGVTKQKQPNCCACWTFGKLEWGSCVRHWRPSSASKYHLFMCHIHDVSGKTLPQLYTTRIYQLFYLKSSFLTNLKDSFKNQFYSVHNLHAITQRTWRICLHSTISLYVCSVTTNTQLTVIVRF